MTFSTVAARQCRVTRWSRAGSSTAPARTAAVPALSRSSAGSPRLPPTRTLQPGALGHAAEERGDRALAVGAGDADHRCVARRARRARRRPRSQASAGAAPRRRTAPRATRPGGDHAHGVLAAGACRAAPRLTGIAASSARSCASCGGGCARVGHGEPPAARAQVARAGERRCGRARRSPRTVRCRASRCSSQLQRGEPGQHQQQRDDPEAHDHLRLRPALELEVMMDAAPCGRCAGR